MNKYITKFYYGGPDERNAGPKAKNDVNFFLNNLGFKNVDIHLEDNKFVKLMKTDLILRRQVNLYEEGIFVLQYPLNSKFITKKILNLIVKNKKIISVCLIHDLVSLRSSNKDASIIFNEINYLNKFDYLIVHNMKMKNWLIHNGATSKMIILELFDYHTPYSISSNEEYECDIVYAGNLIKANFLSNMHMKNKVLNVYGVNERNQYPDNIFYKGSFNPEILPTHLKARFGLVWDGDSINECSGVYGDYLKYNTPHKISLYLSAGIPVIVWKKSAMSEYVVNNNLGISIDSLNIMDDVLDSISENTYLKMKRNALSISRKLRTGYFIKNAIGKAD